MSWCHILLVIVILFITNTSGDDGYMWVMGLYAPSLSWYSLASRSASLFSFALVDIYPFYLVS